MINPEKYYSISELLKLAQTNQFPVKNRTTMGKLIHEGRLKATNVGTGKKRMWILKGSDIIDFLKPKYVDTRRSLQTETS